MWARWVLAGFALLCAGCELHLEVSASIDGDGGGWLQVAVRADADLAQRARDAGADPLGDLAAAGSDLGGGWRVGDTTDEDGTRTVALSSRFAGPEEFARLTADLAEALAAPELAPLSGMSVAVTDDRLIVEGSANLEPRPGVAELGVTPEQAVALVRDSGAFSYEVRLMLPGAVLGTTADAHDGGVVSWSVPPGERVRIVAVSERPQAPWWPLVASALLGGAIAALVLRRAVVVRRRR